MPTAPYGLLALLIQGGFLKSLGHELQPIHAECGRLLLKRDRKTKLASFAKRVGNPPGVLEVLIELPLKDMLVFLKGRFDGGIHTGQELWIFLPDSIGRLHAGGNRNFIVDDQIFENLFPKMGKRVQ